MKKTYILIGLIGLLVGCSESPKQKAERERGEQMESIRLELAELQPILKKLGQQESESKLYWMVSKEHGKADVLERETEYRKKLKEFESVWKRERDLENLQLDLSREQVESKYGPREMK